MLHRTYLCSRIKKKNEGNENQRGGCAHIATRGADARQIRHSSEKRVDDEPTHEKKYTRTHARAQVRPASASLRAQDWFGEIVEAYGDLRDGLLC